MTYLGLSPLLRKCNCSVTFGARVRIEWEGMDSAQSGFKESGAEAFNNDDALTFAAKQLARFAGDNHYMLFPRPADSLFCPATVCV